MVSEYKKKEVLHTNPASGVIHKTHDKEAHKWLTIIYT